MQWMRTRALGTLAIVVAVALLPACSSGDDKPTAEIPSLFQVRGDLRLSGTRYVRGGASNCAGAGPFVDLYKGAFVVIANYRGEPVGLGKVLYGTGTNTFEGLLDECVFRFTVNNLPRAKGYFVFIARQPPKAVPLATLVATDGELQLDANPPLVKG